MTQGSAVLQLYPRFSVTLSNTPTATSFQLFSQHAEATQTLVFLTQKMASAAVTVTSINSTPIRTKRRTCDRRISITPQHKLRRARQEALDLCELFDACSALFRKLQKQHQANCSEHDAPRMQQLADTDSEVYQPLFGAHPSSAVGCQLVCASEAASNVLQTFFQIFTSAFLREEAFAKMSREEQMASIRQALATAHSEAEALPLQPDHAKRLYIAEVLRSLEASQLLRKTLQAGIYPRLEEASIFLKSASTSANRHL